MGRTVKQTKDLRKGEPAKPDESIELAESSIDISAASERFIDAEEASLYLGGLNSRTVTRWAREGYLPAYPIGEGKRRLWRFLEADLEAWMLTRKNNGECVLDIEASEDTLAVAIGAPVGDLHD